MDLHVTPKALPSATIGSIIPVEAAVYAASTGSPFIFEQFIARALKRKAFQECGDEAMADAIVTDFLEKVSLKIEVV